MITNTFGYVLRASYEDIMAENPKDMMDLLYANKLIVIKGLRELSPDELWDLHAKFGDPWSNDDYESTIREPFIQETPGKQVPMFGNGVYKLISYDMPWHRDIPWHQEVKYPIRTLYAHNDYQTPTRFADCDVLWDSPFADLLDDLEIKLQYWYDRQYDQDGEVCRYETKWIPLVEENFFGRRSVMLNSFGLRDRPRELSNSWQTDFRGAWFNGVRNKKTGQEYSDEEFLWLMNALHEFVLMGQSIYFHGWKANDLVLFDNMSGVFHSRSVLDPVDVQRTFYRMNLRHFWQRDAVSPPIPDGPRHMTRT